MHIELPPLASSAAQARAAARTALTQWELNAFEETVALLVTELISNGVRHAGTSLELVLDYEHTCLRVSVTDRAPGLAVTRGNKGTEFGGWGLDLVDALSARWSVDVEAADTKAVWFEIDTRSPPPRRSSGRGSRARVTGVTHTPDGATLPGSSAAPDLRRPVVFETTARGPSHLS